MVELAAYTQAVRHSEVAMPYELLWVKGADPKEGRWPGLRRDEVKFLYGMKVTRDVPVTMRDGITVYVDTFRPEDKPGPFPIILTWSP